MKLADITTDEMAMPGNSTVHHAWVMWFRASAGVLFQAGVG